MSAAGPFALGAALLAGLATAGLTATVYHLVGLFGGLLLALIEAARTRRGGWAPSAAEDRALARMAPHEGEPHHDPSRGVED